MTGFYALEIEFYVIILTQISKIEGCKLNRIGDLAYEMFRPACGTFEFPEERIMYCFGEAAKSDCYRWNMTFI